MTMLPTVCRCVLSTLAKLLSSSHLFPLPCCAAWACVGAGSGHLAAASRGCAAGGRGACQVTCCCCCCCCCCSEGYGLQSIELRRPDNAAAMLHGSIALLE